MLGNREKVGKETGGYNLQASQRERPLISRCFQGNAGAKAHRGRASTTGFDGSRSDHLSLINEAVQRSVLTRKCGLDQPRGVLLQLKRHSS